MVTCPLCEYGLICLHELRLKYGESTNHDYQKEGKEARLRNSEYEVWSSFGESFFEHLEGCEEDDKESDPLDGWVFLKLPSYPT